MNKTIKIGLKAARVNAGYKQREAAKMLNISQPTLIKWEQGINFPNAKQIEEIVELYGIPYDNLIFSHEGYGFAE